MPKLRRGRKKGAEELSDSQDELAEPLAEPGKAKVHNFKFPQYDEELERWSYYVNRFEVEICRVELTGSIDDRTRSILFLTSVGPNPFKILVDHFRPRDVKEVSYDELKDVLGKFYEKSTCMFAERRAFAMRTRNEGESIAKFVNGLRTLAGTCEFGTALEERLRDQLVIGINSSKWQEELIRLHQTNEATFQEVETSALTMEKAETQQMLLAEFSNSDSRKIFHTKTGPPQRKPTQILRKKRVEKECNRCGFEQHSAEVKCPAKGQECLNCHKIGHFARVCMSKKTPKLQMRQVSNKKAGESDESEVSSEEDNSLNNIKTTGNKVMLKVKLNNLDVDMLYDVGAAKSVINRKLWKQLGEPRLYPCTGLVGYTGVEIETLGKIRVQVHCFDRTLSLMAVVVKKHDVPLFGLDWALKFEVPMPKGARICSLQASMSKKDNPSKTLNKILSKYPNIFSEGLGTMKGYKAKIQLIEGAEPKAFRHRTVPFALKDKVDQELDRLVSEGILEVVDPVINPIEWASPIVVCVKPTGAVRICGDFKVTVNKFIQAMHYPLPTFDDLIVKLSGGQEFSVIDLKDAYLQMEVEEESRKFLVITTHKGFFRYTRLPFGVSFAPGVFQKRMEDILAGMKNVACLLDDIIITAKTREEHLKTLEEVLSRLDKNGIKTQVAKCKWLQQSVKYLGHVIDKEGIHPLEDHLKAMREMPPPKNVQELKSFLGTINYYGRFIENLQLLCAPLHGLTRKGVKWNWSTKFQEIFEKVKSKLTAADTLIHYSPELPLVITSDASLTGVGAVLFHRLPDGSERPIMYASRMLSTAEKNYSSIDREALGLIFAVKKFYQFIQGRKFVLKTDHKPLKYILAEDKEIPKMAANRLMRWALILRSFDYSIEYIAGKENTVADTLSRLPIKENEELSEHEKLGKPGAAQLLHLHLRDSPVTRKEIKRHIASDKLLQNVIRYVQSGWPLKKDLDQSMYPYFEKREELSYEEGILLWSGRIIVPDSIKENFLKMLHLGHPGSRAMRSVARIHMWWPGIDKELERYVGNCLRCQGSRPAPEEAPIFFLEHTIATMVPVAFGFCWTISWNNVDDNSRCFIEVA